MTVTRDRGPATSEDGQTSVLLVGFFVVLLMLVAVVVNASAAYLSRERLASLADGAALAAADSLATERLYVDGVSAGPALEAQAARAHAEAYLAAARQSHPGLSHRVSTQGDTVHVVVTAPLELPLTPPGWLDSTRVSARSSAVIRVG